MPANLLHIAYVLTPSRNAHADVGRKAMSILGLWVTIYTNTLCMRVTKVLVSLRIWADSPETSFLDKAIRTNISRAGLIMHPTRVFLQMKVIFLLVNINWANPKTVSKTPYFCWMVLSWADDFMKGWLL